MRRYTNTAEIVAVVEGLESCRTNKDSFKHQDHLVVAVVYLQELAIAEAATRLRGNLLRFLDHHQVDRQKYNETITVFWLELVANAVQNLDPETTIVEKCNQVVELFKNATLVFEYYSRERLFSDEARETFVQPDLKNWR